MSSTKSVVFLSHLQHLEQCLAHTTHSVNSCALSQESWWSLDKNLDSLSIPPKQLQAISGPCSRQNSCLSLISLVPAVLPVPRISGAPPSQSASNKNLFCDFMPGGFHLTQFGFSSSSSAESKGLLSVSSGAASSPAVGGPRAPPQGD